MELNLFSNIKSRGFYILHLSAYHNLKIVHQHFQKVVREYKFDFLV